MNEQLLWRLQPANKAISVSDNYRRVLFMLQRGFGDLVIAIPALHALRRALPETEIFTTISPSQLELADPLCSTIIHGTIPVPGRRRLADLVGFLSSVRRLSPDLIVDFCAIYIPLIGVRRRCRIIGMPREEIRRRTRFLPRERLCATESPHRVDRYMELLPHLGLSTRSVNFDIPTNSLTLKSMQQLLERHGMAGDRVVAFVPQSYFRVKSWPAETLNETIRTMVGDMHCRCVVVGGVQDCAIPTESVLDLRGRTTLLEVAHLLRYSGMFSLIIGVDTGLMQFAGSINSDDEGNYPPSSTGNYTISLFGPSNAERDRPYDPTGRFNRVIRTEKPPNGSWRPDMMPKITARMIIEGVEEHLAVTRAPAGRAKSAAGD